MNAPLVQRTPEPSILARAAILLLEGYQVLISPLLHTLGGGGCRFHPTCSTYAVEAVRKYGALSGALRAARRLLRCHPLHPGGFDPP